MNLAKSLIIFFLSAIPFAFLLFEPVPLGGDAPFFFAVSCDPSLDSSSIPLFSLFFFYNLPCNLLLFKIVSFLALFLSSLIVAYIGELFDKNIGWLAGVLVFFSVSWIHFHIQVEDDLIAYPFLFLALYFFIKADLNKSNHLRAIAIALIVFTGALIWKGALLYLAAFSFFWVPALIVLYVVLFYIGFGSMHAILGNNLVVENMNALVAGGLGLGHGIGLFGLYLIFRNWLTLRVKALWLIVPFFVAMLLNVKWAVQLSPFLALGLMFLVKDFEENKFKYFKTDWVTKNSVLLIVLMAFLMVLGLSIGLLFMPPHPNQLEAVKETIRLSDETGLPISNDWSYGYWIRFFGGIPDNEGGGGLISNLKRPAITLTEQPVKNCEILRNFEKGFNYDLRLYKC